MARRRRFSDKTGVGRSALIPKQQYEPWDARHARRLAFNLAEQDKVKAWAAERGITLTITNHGHHWKFIRDQQVAEWWPSSAKLVVGQRYSKGVHVHDHEQARSVLDRVFPA